MQYNKPVAHLLIEDYTYELPAERIASYPLPRRDSSRLLVTQPQGLTLTEFGQLAEFLQPGSLMVLNNTRVVQARLEFFKSSGARIEIFCLQPLEPVQDVHLALGQASPVSWQCLIGNAKKWKSDLLEISSPEGNFRLWAVKQVNDGPEFSVTFSWEPAHLSFGEVLDLVGKTPLPPYITRKAEFSDKVTYQTMYALTEGSVAAPTAGLHFTPEVFQKLAARNISPHYVTLHVGAGTFKPVSSSTIGDHRMHSEQFVVEKSFLETLIHHHGPVVSVGTTSMRTLESIYWLGVKMLKGYLPVENNVKVEQWEPYATNPLPSPAKAFEAVLAWIDSKGFSFVQGETALIIVPGYDFKVVDVLVTNFHQPKSTLLLLVAAFAGEQWKQTYQFALDQKLRFLSYGDSCLFFRNNH